MLCSIYRYAYICTYITQHICIAYCAKPSTLHILLTQGAGFSLGCLDEGMLKSNALA
jgi:hypothetical protein